MEWFPLKKQNKQINKNAFTSGKRKGKHIEWVGKAETHSCQNPGEVSHHRERNQNPELLPEQQRICTPAWATERLDPKLLALKTEVAHGPDTCRTLAN